MSCYRLHQHRQEISAVSAFDHLTWQPAVVYCSFSLHLLLFLLLMLGCDLKMLLKIGYSLYPAHFVVIHLVILHYMDVILGFI